MSLGIDPFLASLLFSAGLVPHAAKVRAIHESPSLPPAVFPFVTVIVALHREKWDDIDMTVQSLSRQTYPKDRYEILLVVEADDPDVRSFAETAINQPRVAGISARVVISDGKRRLKAYALNRAIEQARGELCAFYDASDDIEETQI